MPADASGNSFQAGRANLRDTAKWIVSGSIGAATLIIGSSTISGLGTLPLGPRLFIAVAALLVAAGLCWFPFQQAIDVLRSEVLTLDQFTGAEAGVELKQSIDNLSTVLGVLPEAKTLREFVNDYPAARTAGVERRG